ncbi:uncharacterized [Tachysurus ichikawai]
MLNHQGDEKETPQAGKFTVDSQPWTLCILCVSWPHTLPSISMPVRVPMLSAAHKQTSGLLPHPSAQMVKPNLEFPAYSTWSQTRSPPHLTNNFVTRPSPFNSPISPEDETEGVALPRCRFKKWSLG